MRRSLVALVLFLSTTQMSGSAEATFKRGTRRPSYARRVWLLDPLSAVMSSNDLACAQYHPMTGQSNGLGSGATPALSTSSANADVGTWDATGGEPCTAVEGVGACTPLIDAPGGDADLETGLVAMGDTLVALGSFTGPILVEAGGANATEWTGVDSDSTEWTRQLGPSGELADAVTYYSTNEPLCVRTGALDIWHGEADDILGTSAATYEGYMQAAWDDLVTDVAEENPTQRSDPAIVLMQMTDPTETGITLPRSTVAEGQLAAALDTTRLIYLGAPKYAYPHQAANEIHFSNAGQRRAKEYHAFVRDRIANDRSFPHAFAPSSVTVNGSDSSCVDLDYTGRIPCESGDNCDAAPLAFDTTLVNESWINMGLSHGFQIFDPNPFPAKIDATPTISGSTVQVCTDKAIRTGTSIGYALEGVPGAHGGPGTLATGDYAAARGNLRDTNQLTGARSTSNLYAWAHAGEFAVTGGAAPPGNTAEIFDFDFTELWAGRSGGCPAASGAWVGEVSATSIGHNSGTHTCDVATTGATSGPAGAGIGNMGGEAVDGNTQIWNQASQSIGNRTATQDLWIRAAGCFARNGVGVASLIQQRVSSTCRWEMAVSNTGAVTFTVNTSGCSSAGQNQTVTLAAFVPASSSEVWTVCDGYLHARGSGEALGRLELCCNGTCGNASMSAAVGTNDTGSIFLNGFGTAINPGTLLAVGFGIGVRAFGNVNSAGWDDGTVMVRNLNEQAYAAMCPSPPCACTP